MGYLCTFGVFQVSLVQYNVGFLLPSLIFSKQGLRSLYVNSIILSCQLKCKYLLVN